ncbi:astacin-like metalloendopeptidase isoform X2 [Rhineura floridana]|uniref:astacin-like metalloendopeptidase isoform X2 n=1 Tax=Rhineura floridana TaxID=261503 RepID=UPI002AC867FE|nr:astacin-like metalloendopeptidase isoform X2 [Rhineura floridana]
MVGIWLIFVGLFWLFSALPVRGRGDSFQVAHAQESDSDEARDPPDDILDINQELVFPGAPESSFLIEGDIIKVNPFRLFPSANPRWPKKRGTVQIPYVISYKYDKSSVKILKEAFKDFARFTCIKFVPYSYQRDFIAIAPLSGCFSSVGRIGGMQVVSLAPACLNRGKGVALHELMHVVGFWHEHSRADRDKYISISWNEILTGFETNFMKSWNTNMLVDYDYSSVMHYGRNAFSVTGLPTIIPLSGSYTFLGQRWNLSNSDIARVNKLYKCSQVATQPETATERVVVENIMDFIPSELKPCTTENKAKFSTVSARELLPPAREPLGTTVPASQVVGKTLSTTETQAKGIWSPGPEKQNQSTTPLHPPGEAEGSQKSWMVTEEMPQQTQPGETESQMVSGAAQKTSVSQALQYLTSSARALKERPPSSTEAYIQREQSLTEARTRVAPEVELSLSYLTKTPIPFLTETVQGAATRPGKEAPHQPLSGTAMHVEPRVELSATTEVGSSGSEGGNGSPSPTEGRPFSVMENQTKEQLTELLHQAIGVFRNETGNLAYTSPMEGVQTKATSFSYMTPSPGGTSNPVTASPVWGLEETLQSEVGSLASFGTVGSQGGMAKKEVGRFYTKKSNVPTYTPSSASSKQHATHKLAPALSAATEGSPALASSEAPERHLGQAAAGASSPWTAIMGPLAVSRPWVATSSESSQVQVGQFYRPPAQLARKGYRTESSVTHIPPRSVMVQVTEPELEAPGRAQLSSQTSTLAEQALLSMAMHPPIGTSPLPPSRTPKTTGPRHEAPWMQPSNTKGYSHSALSTGRTPFADLYGEEFEHSKETTTITTTWPTRERKMNVSYGKEVGTRHPEEAKICGRASLQTLFPTEPFGSQMPIRPGNGLVGTRRPSSPTLLVGTRVTGAGNSVIQTRNPNGPGKAASLRQCGGGLAGSSSGPKSSYMERTTKRLASVNKNGKTAATSQKRPGMASKEQSPTSEGKSLPARERSTLLKEDTLPAVVSEPMRTMPPERAPERTVASDKGFVSVASFSLPTILLLGKPALKGSQSSAALGRTEPVTISESPSTQSLEAKASTKPKEILTFAEGERTEPGNATEQVFLHGSPTWKGPAGRNGAQSPSLDMEPARLPQVAMEGTDLLLPTGSLKSPRLTNFSSQPVQSTSSQPRKEAMPTIGKALTADTASVPSTYLSRATPLDTWGNQAAISSGAKEATPRISKERGETVVETYASTLASAETHRVPSTGASTLGSPDKHAASTAKIPQFQPVLQTEMEYLKGVTWPASEVTTSGLLLEDKGRSLRKESSRHVSKEMEGAINSGIGSKRSGLNGAGTAGVTSLGTRPSSSQLSYTNFSEEREGHTTLHRKKGTVHSSAGPTSKPISGASTYPHLGYGTTEIVPSVPGVQNSPGTEQMETEMSSVAKYLMGMEDASVTAKVSQVHPQPLGLAETGIWKYKIPHVTRGPEEVYIHNKLPLSKGTPLGIGKGKQTASSAESSRQGSETRIAVKLEEMSGKQTKETKSKQNRISSINNHNYLRHVDKRSLAEIMATPASLMVSPPAEIGPGHGSVGHKDEALTTQNVARVMELTKVTGMSRSLALLQRLHSALEKAGNDTVVHHRTVVQPLTFCSFEKNFCGWEQSKDDDLDWMLDEGREQFAPTVEGRNILGKSCKTSGGGHLSMMPLAHIPSQKAVRISPVADGIRCLKLWYSPMDPVLGEITIYTKLLNSSEWHKVWSVKGNQGTGWHPVTIAISELCELLQVALEGVVGPKVRCGTGTDDLFLCRKPCGQCYNDISRFLCNKGTK